MNILTRGEAGKLASGYLGELEVCGSSPETLRSYGKSLTLFFGHLDNIGVDFRRVRYENLLTFLQSIRLTGVKAATVRSRFSAVSAWYKWLRRIRVVKENPCELVPAIKADERLPDFFTEEEIGKLRQAAATESGYEAVRNAAILEFIYASGCRRGEVSRLDVEDVHIGPNTYATIKHTKGRRDRMAILDSPGFVQAWEAYLPVRARALARWERPTEKAAFISQRGGTRIEPWGVWSAIKILCQRAGVRELYPHAIRHSAATHMMNHGADLIDIRDQLGHRSLSTTEIYLHVALERRQAQYRKSHPAACPVPVRE